MRPLHVGPVHDDVGTIPRYRPYTYLDIVCTIDRHIIELLYLFIFFLISRRDYLMCYRITKTSSSSHYKYRSKSPYRRPNTNVYAYYSTISNNVGLNNPQIKNKNLKKCSMRINELAVPSKRQCLDTWRYRSNVLPEFMVRNYWNQIFYKILYKVLAQKLKLMFQVVRLKQQVMDQLPIVQIPEALYWFQKRRPRKSYSSKTYYNSLIN